MSQEQWPFCAMFSSVYVKVFLRLSSVRANLFHFSTAQLTESGSGGLMEQRKPGPECIPKKMGVYIIHELKRNGKP